MKSHHILSRGAIAAFGLFAVTSLLAYGCSSSTSEDALPDQTPDTGTTDPGPGSDSGNPQDAKPVDSGPGKIYKAYAKISTTSLAGGLAEGLATFTEQDGSVTVVVNRTNAAPVSVMHGMHIHANGSCADADAGTGNPPTAAGGAGAHWNPLDAGHGYPDASVHHAGDMGNISIDANGKGTLTLVTKEWTVQPGPKSVVGHALIFHVQKDDGVSQPVGDAGARPGCALIGTDPPPVCLDDTPPATAPTCAASCNAQCTTINANFKKGVAGDAIKALTTMSCTNDTANTTVDTSLGNACTDATAIAYCDNLVQNGCTAGAFPQFGTDCRKAANGMTGTGIGAASTLGRKALYDCLNGPGLDCTKCLQKVKGKVNP